jgi:1-acyl-sn-glycerol-3-phosphate acyltransferase
VTTTATRRHTATRSIYGCYAWISLLLVVLPCAALLAVVPRVERRRRVARRAARLVFWLIGRPIRVEGEPIAPSPPCIVIANHASYLDGIILTAALPAHFTYLIKHEMATFPLAGFILRRLGSAFVNRDDIVHRKRTARKLVDLALQGHALAFFPEGTFDAPPGLRPFQLGAFGAAIRAGLPIVPLTIHGSREMLGAGALLPSPAPLRVRVCAPLVPARYRSARELMQAARQVMLEQLDEPDLDAAPDGAAEAPGYISV